MTLLDQLTKYRAEDRAPRPEEAPPPDSLQDSAGAVQADLTEDIELTGSELDGIKLVLEPAPPEPELPYPDTPPAVKEPADQPYDTPLLELLAQYSAHGRLPMHMPGHKRHALDDRLPYELDITEIQGFDDLYHPDGILADAMRRAADCWGSGRCFYLVGGSTVGILACVRAASLPGQRVLIARNCHKSVYHAVELCALRPVYLLPEWDSAFGIWGSLTPETLERAFNQNPDACLAVVTSPTYEGVRSDIAALARVAHEHGAALLVDEAHGAHLPDGAVAAGADLVVQSLHKTLPALTQTALCHCRAAYAKKVQRELEVFQTSSPSYPLMASIDQCVGWLRREAPRAFAAYERRLAELDAQYFSHLRILCHAGDRRHAFYGYDYGKLYLRGGASGPELAAVLRRLGVEPEMTAEDGVLLMTTVFDTDEDFQTLIRALYNADALVGDPPPARARPPVLPVQRQIPCRAIRGDVEWLPPEQAVGCMAAEYLWAYPPGVPLLVPGEEVPAELPEMLRRSRGLQLVSTSGRLPDILVHFD